MGIIVGLAATGVYALYTGYVAPWEQQLEQAGFGGTNLLGLLIFQGAFWKGWQSMVTLLEVLALVTLAGFAMMIVRRRTRRGYVLAMLVASLLAEWRWRARRRLRSIARGKPLKCSARTR